MKCFKEMMKNDTQFIHDKVLSIYFVCLGENTLQ